MRNGSGATLDQRRARHAWEAAARIKARSGRKTDSAGESRRGMEPGVSGTSYAREAKRLSVRILTAGLGHALAFLKAKSGAANEALLRDVADWVLDKRVRPDSRSERPRADALIEAIVQKDGTFLQTTTDEALAYLQWLTRFTEAEFGADED